MAILKKHLTPLRKRGQVDVHKGKGAAEQQLPSRGAMSTLTQGDPGQRTMQNYAKATPTPPAQPGLPPSMPMGMPPPGGGFGS